MKRIVLTGGPCSGKTTVQKALLEEFSSRLVLVPEAATLLLEGGFPVPGDEFPWSEEWQSTLQTAILPLQKSLEDAHALVAKQRGNHFLVCDRGILDGAAYSPGGVPEFCKTHGLNVADVLARYEAIIHLESLATSDPERYGKTGNESRFEPLERAQLIEKNTQAAWADHPHHLIIRGKRGFEAKVSEVLGIIRFLLAEKV